MTGLCFYSANYPTLTNKILLAEKYQDVFFEHCERSFSMSSRSTQLAILASIARVLERLSVLSTDGEPMETDNLSVTGRDKALSTVIGHVANIIDYTLSK